MTSDDQTKTCSRCGLEKPLDEFWRNSTGAGGREARCRACSSARTTPGVVTLVELDTTGLVGIVADSVLGDLLVEWRGDRWLCDCGEKGCLHLARVGQALPLAVALRMTTGPKAGASHGAKPAGVSRDVQQERARRLAAGQDARAARAAEVDAERAVVDTSVTVRVMTAEDAQRLAAARARKSRTYQAAGISGQFAG